MKLSPRLLFCLLLLACFAPGWAADHRIFAPLVKDAAASQSFQRKALTDGRCLASDIFKEPAGTLVRGSSEKALAPGHYRLHVPLALGPLADLNISAITITITAGEVKRSVTMLHFPRADEFVDLPVDITVSVAQDIPISISWDLTSERARKNREKAMPTLDNPDVVKAEDDFENAPAAAEDADGMIAIKELKRIEYHLAACGIHFEALSPVQVRVTADKIVYKPGETGTATVTLTNAGAVPAQATLKLRVDAGLTSSTEVGTATVALAAGESKTWTGSFPTKDLRWGADLIAAVRVGEGPLAEERFTFAATDNFWETSLVSGMMFSAHYIEPAAAEKFIQDMEDAGYTAMESGFWAPDEFGDFTPDEKIDIFFGGQGSYPGSVKGTKNVINALHKRGMAATVYANLWGGDGADSYEMMRKHPDWFSDGGGASTDWLENWQLMFTKKIPPIHVWPYTVINRENSAEALKVHARELIDSHRQLGWDGVRYDSYYSDDWVTPSTATVRKLVEAELPEYRWGYNSLIPQDQKANALDIMCRGGQLAMEEGLRHIGKGSASLTKYNATLARFRDIVWPHDGHLGICYDVPMQSTGYDGTLLDEIYVCTGLLAAGAHPYYGTMDRRLGNFPRFALRYSEFLFYNKMLPLKEPDKVIKFGGNPKLMNWPQLVRTVSLGGDRHRLVIHLINAPVEDLSLKNIALKTPPVFTNLPVTITLPPGAAVQGAWTLCPIPDAAHQAVQGKRAGDELTVTVPELRFWTVLVIDYSAKEGL
ncbi:MAG: hypothetical protein ACYC7E_09440 [Armatimonadota bacterium]